MAVAAVETRLGRNFGPTRLLPRPCLRMGTLRLLAVAVRFVVPQAFGVVSGAKLG